jgi:hypothetical protein
MGDLWDNIKKASTGWVDRHIFNKPGENNPPAEEPETLPPGMIRLPSYVGGGADGKGPIVPDTPENRQRGSGVYNNPSAWQEANNQAAAASQAAEAAGHPERGKKINEAIESAGINPEDGEAARAPVLSGAERVSAIVNNLLNSGETSISDEDVATTLEKEGEEEEGEQTEETTETSQEETPPTSNPPNDKGKRIKDNISKLAFALGGAAQGLAHGATGGKVGQRWEDTAAGQQYAADKQQERNFGVIKFSSDQQVQQAFEMLPVKEKEAAIELKKTIRQLIEQGKITRNNIKTQTEEEVRGTLLLIQKMAGVSFSDAFKAAIVQNPRMLTGMAADAMGGAANLFSTLAGNGKSSGGYTGPGDKYEPAGIVHKGEYVIPKEGVDQKTGLPKKDWGNPLLEDLQAQFGGKKRVKPPEKTWQEKLDIMVKDYENHKAKRGYTLPSDGKTWQEQLDMMMKEYERKNAKRGFSSGGYTGKPNDGKWHGLAKSRDNPFTVTNILKAAEERDALKKKQQSQP